METTSALKKYFTKQLLAWHSTENDRSLPWKQEKDTYKIWLSEIILQQTRALQGLPYYLKFVEAYPTVTDMAKAVDEDVFRIWQGLGYYNRCKNMLATARYIAQNLAGIFPSTYDGLLSLKGIGPYTAAAIASFSYGLPHAVVDGNVYRVLARYFGIEEPTDTQVGKVIFQQLAQELLNKNDSAAYNQAIMDLGAVVCTPKAPACLQCPLQEHCVAFKRSLIPLLPVKSKKVEVKERYFHYIFFIAKNEVWISKRGPGDIWENLYQPYLVEHNSPLGLHSLTIHMDINKLGIPVVDIVYAGNHSQRLTHRLIKTSFFVANVDTVMPIPGIEGKWVPLEALKNFAFPKTVVQFLEKKLYF